MVATEPAGDLETHSLAPSLVATEMVVRAKWQVDEGASQAPEEKRGRGSKTQSAQTDPQMTSIMISIIRGSTRFLELRRQLNRFLLV